MFKNSWLYLSLTLCLLASVALQAGQNTQVDRATRDYLIPESMKSPQSDEIDAIADAYCDPENPDDSEACDLIIIKEDPCDEQEKRNP